MHNAYKENNTACCNKKNGNSLIPAKPLENEL